MLIFITVIYYVTHLFILIESIYKINIIMYHKTIIFCTKYVIVKLTWMHVKLSEQFWKLIEHFNIFCNQVYNVIDYTDNSSI